MTLIERIVAKHVVGDPAEVRPGAIVRIRPQHVMTHDNTAAVMPKFAQLFENTGLEPTLNDSAQPVFAIDHDIQNTSPVNLEKYAKIRSFARTHSIDFYPAGTGISHQVMIERGYVTPGSLIVGSDSHSNMYGAIGAVGTPIVRTDAACVWATGQTWWRVPETWRVELTGRLREGVSGKDVIVSLCGAVSDDQVLGAAVEFGGGGVRSLSVAQRMSICNMTTEWGAVAGVMPMDEVLRDWLLKRARAFSSGDGEGIGEVGPASRRGFSENDVGQWWEQWGSQNGADEGQYAGVIEVDLGRIGPSVAGPNDVKRVQPVSTLERERVQVNKAYLVSCVNARLEDLQEAARVLERCGGRVAQGVKLYVAAASAQVEQAARESGAWDVLMRAGAIALPSGCGPCIGLGEGLVEAGEVAISATNRNFPGRMGSREGQVYLASPAVVAASAARGYISGPELESSQAIVIRTTDDERVSQISRNEHSSADEKDSQVGGRGVFVDADDVSTDGIYAGKWTYRESMSDEEMAAVVFENHDPSLGAALRAGDVLAVGYNFGTGSSREQAATALLARGVRCVVAGSVNETYLRNAINNGLMCVRCPDVIEWLRRQGEGNGGWREIGDVRLNVSRWELAVGNERFAVEPMSRVGMEMIEAGGVLAHVRGQLMADRVG